MTPDPTHPNVYPSKEEYGDQGIDTTPPPANEAPSEQAPEAAAEAVRTGREDQSVNVGAKLPSDDQRMASGKPTTVGDPDAMTEQAKVVGEEAVGGTTPTPDQDNVDDIAASVGIDIQAEQPVAVEAEMRQRDAERFELDPDSKGPASSA